MGPGGNSIRTRLHFVHTPGSVGSRDQERTLVGSRDQERARSGLWWAHGTRSGLWWAHGTRSGLRWAHGTRSGLRSGLWWAHRTRSELWWAHRTRSGLWWAHRTRRAQSDFVGSGPGVAQERTLWAHGTRSGLRSGLWWDHGTSSGLTSEICGLTGRSGLRSRLCDGHHGLQDHRARVNWRHAGCPYRPHGWILQLKYQPRHPRGHCSFDGRH